MLITIHVIASRYGRANCYTKTFHRFKEVKDFIDFEIYGDDQYVCTIYLRALKKKKHDQDFEVIDKVFDGKYGGELSGYNDFRDFCKEFFNNE